MLHVRVVCVACFVWDARAMMRELCFVYVLCVAHMFHVVRIVCAVCPAMCCDLCVMGVLYVLCMSCCV